MADKIKIRKVEATPGQIFERIEKILEVSEKAYGKWKGTPLKELCLSLGLRELDFYEIRFDYKQAFNEKFIIVSDNDYKPAVIKVLRLSTYNDPNRKKSQLNEFYREE